MRLATWRRWLLLGCRRPACRIERYEALQIKSRMWTICQKIQWSTYMASELTTPCMRVADKVGVAYNYALLTNLDRSPELSRAFHGDKITRCWQILIGVLIKFHHLISRLCLTVSHNKRVRGASNPVAHLDPCESSKLWLTNVIIRNRMPVSLRGGEGELGNLKT
jgi:hypothetical protein